MEILIAVDIGSSSIRCSAYTANANTNAEDTSSSVSVLENCIASRTVRSVQPNTGKIQLFSNTTTTNTTTAETEMKDRPKSLMDHVDDCIDELLETLRQQQQTVIKVVGLGISSFVMNLVGVDKEGNVVGESASISYACNTTDVANVCRTLRSQILSEEDIQHMYQRSGAPIHSAYALPQLLDIYTNSRYESVRKDIHKWQTIATLCLCRWTGERFLPISYSEASWTGLLDFRYCQYEPKSISLLPEACREALPDLADFSDPTHPLGNGIGEQTYRKQHGSTQNPYWERWPELRGARLFLGLGDGACANIGSKCSTPARIAVTIGTSAAARICLPLPVVANATADATTASDAETTVSPGKDDDDDDDGTSTNHPLVVPKGLFCYRINRHHVLLGGALTDGGSVVEWIATLLNLSTTTELDECFERVENLVEEDYISAEEGQQNTAAFTVVPFLSGERSTGFRDNATCAMLGLTRSTTPAHVVKSCLEGVTLRLNAILKLLIQQSLQHHQKQQQGSDSDSDSTSRPCVVASGKALEVNSLWRQLIADCSDLEVIMDKETQEGTSRGVACAMNMALKDSNRDQQQQQQQQQPQFFSDEPLVVSVQSKPNHAGKTYWKQAEMSQERLLEAVSPLY